MNRDAVVERLNALDMPYPDRVIIVAGAAMAMSGIRLASDIDLVVDDENWRYLHQLKGWEEQVFSDDQIRLVDSTGVFDAWKGWTDRRITPPKPIDFAEIFSMTQPDPSGFRVPNVMYQITMKEQLARPEDIQDITLLRDFLDKQ